MNLFKNPIVLDLLAKYKPIAAMAHTSALLGWDLEINMPEAGAIARGQAQAEIELLRQKMTLDLTGLIEKAEKQKTLNDAEKGVIRVIKRELDFYQKVPPELLEELQKATVEASVPWREARKKADFQIFQPHLEKITDLKRKQAEHLDPSTHPYNALLDIFEEGLTINDLDRIFSVLIPQLKRILSKTLAQGNFPKKHPLEDADYDVQALKQVNEKLTGLLGMPEKRFRQDVSTHPFSIRIAGDDVRITTRYEPKNFNIAMRYELEKKMLQGTVQVSELPSVWNDMIEEYLGKRPTDDAQGVLQDVHWSGGQYANFPGYSLGNVIAGMLWSTLTKKKLLPINGDKSIPALKGWLAENVHRPGATYPPQELLNRVFGHGYDPSGLVSYLENKYLAVN